LHSKFDKMLTISLFQRSSILLMVENRRVRFKKTEKDRYGWYTMRVLEPVSGLIWPIIGLMYSRKNVSDGRYRAQKKSLGLATEALSIQGYDSLRQ